MSRTLLHDLLNLTTAVALHLHEAKAGVHEHAVASEHIDEALAITRRIDTYIRNVKITK